MPVVAAIIGGSVIAGAATVISGRQASRASERATSAAIDKEWEMYQQSREDYAPWREAGTEALTSLQQLVAAGPGEFKPEETPGYKFGFEELVSPYLSAQSARGKRLSGETLKGLTEYGVGYAEKAYDNFLNRYYAKMNPLLSLAGLGQTAAGGTAQSALDIGKSIGTLQGQNALTQGNIASGTTAVMGGIGQNALKSYMDYITMKPHRKPIIDEIARKMGATTSAPYTGPMAGMY